MPPAAQNTTMAMFVCAEGHLIHVPSQGPTESAKGSDHRNEDGLCADAGTLNISFYARSHSDTTNVGVADEHKCYFSSCAIQPCNVFFLMYLEFR